MNNSNCLVSVIIPVFNVEKTLTRCVDSILKQSDNHFEVLLIDDGSTDKSSVICDEYAAKTNNVKVFHKKNGGLSSARNYGIDRANGDYLCFVDSDDWIHHRFIELLRYGIDHYNTDFSCCRCRSVTQEMIEDSFITDSYHFNCYTSKEFLLKAYSDKQINIFAWNKMYRKELFQQVRYPEGKLFEDAIPMYQIGCLSKNVSIINEDLYYYYIKGNSITRSDFKIKDEDSVEQWHTIVATCENNNPDIYEAAFAKLAIAYLGLINKICMSQKIIGTYYIIKYRDFLKNNRKKIFTNNYLSTTEKSQICIILTNWHLYKLLYKFYKYKK